MRLFDLHCDTALCLYNDNLKLSSSSLHIDLEKTAPFDAYVQVSAIWSRKHLDNDAAWECYLHAGDAFVQQIAENGNTALVTDSQQIREAVSAGKRAFLPAVEDARMLNGDLSRLTVMYSRGVRILTLCWGGETCIGGSHDTDAPLTDFGRAVVRRCFECGIVPDVSHASRAVTAETLAMAKAAGKPVIASHSDACGVRCHTRNLTDEEFRLLLEVGGIVGITLVPSFLTEPDTPCTLASIAAHIRHFLALGGEDALCLGCDFDGVSQLPDGIGNVSHIVKLAEYLRAEGMSDELIDKIFFTNAYNFAMRNF